MKSKPLQLYSLLGGLLLVSTALLTQSWMDSGAAAPISKVKTRTNSHQATAISSTVNTVLPTAPQDVVTIAAQLASAASGEQKSRLCDALARIGTDESMQAFTNAVLIEKNETTRIEMLRALDSISSPAALELTTSLLAITNEPSVIAAVNRTISRMANADTVQFLSELYDEKEAIPGQHQRVIEALALVRNPSAVPAQLALLNATPNDELGFASALSLAKIGTPEAVTGLVTAFSQLPPERFAERQLIIENLSGVSNAQSIEHLRQLSTESEQPLIKEAARLAIESMSALASNGR